MVRRVVFSCSLSVMHGIKVMAVRRVGMVRGLFVVAGCVMLRCLVVVAGGVLVVLGGLGVVLGAFLAHTICFLLSVGCFSNLVAEGPPFHNVRNLQGEDEQSKAPNTEYKQT